MRLLGLALFCILAGIGVAAHAEQPVPTPTPSLPSFEFRGHRAGEAQPADCLTKATALFTSCEDKASGPLFNRHIGPVLVHVFRYDYFEGKLFRLMLSTNTFLHPQLRDMLIGKYGPPAQETTGKITTLAGVEYDNLTSVWTFAEGNLVLNERQVDINQSWLMFENPSTAAKISALEAERNKALGAGSL